MSRIANCIFADTAMFMFFLGIFLSEGSQPKKIKKKNRRRNLIVNEYDVVFYLDAGYVPYINPTYLVVFNKSVNIVLSMVKVIIIIVYF